MSHRIGNKVESQYTPKVLKDRQNIVKETAQKIQEAKALYAKAYEQVSQSWEALVDDKELEKVIKQFHTTKEIFNKLKNELKKLPIVEKMSNNVDFKIIQQQVARLWTQQQQTSRPCRIASNRNKESYRNNPPNS